MKPEFLYRFTKNSQISDFMKIRPVVAERTDGQTEGQADMTKLIVVFRNFANAPKNAKQETTTACTKTINLMASPFKVQ